MGDRDEGELLAAERWDPPQAAPLGVTPPPQEPPGMVFPGVPIDPEGVATG